MTAETPLPFDPTLNVRELVAAEARRLDQEIAAIRREQGLRDHYDGLLREAEAKRLDATRAVDVAAVTAAQNAATATAAVLASQVATSAETLRALMVTQTATISDRISALERTSYVGTGKGAGADYLWRAAVVVLGLLFAASQFLK